MQSKTLHLAGAVALCTVLAACGQPDAVDDDTAQALRQEIERLENEIGRLEFRLYELESAVHGGADQTPAEIPVRSEGQPDEAPAGRYDLTPVE